MVVISTSNYVREYDTHQTSEYSRYLSFVQDVDLHSDNDFPKKVVTQFPQCLSIIINMGLLIAYKIIH